MSVIIFSLLSIVTPEEGRTRHDEIQNGAASTAAFVLGGVTSIVSGYLGMQIATYANARTAVEARKGIAPAFMCGTCRARAGGWVGTGRPTRGLCVYVVVCVWCPLLPPAAGGWVRVCVCV